MSVLLTDVLFLCLGFTAAVLCIDLVFDVACWRYRRDPKGIPPEILAPVAAYYRFVTRAPHLLVAVLLTAVACVALENVYHLVPRSLGYPSLLCFGLASLVAVVKVIPTAQRLGSTRDVTAQCRLAYSLLPYHVAMLASVLLLAAAHIAAI
jgi:hypothetical protein